MRYLSHFGWIASFFIAALITPLGAAGQTASKAVRADWPSRPVHILVGFPGGSSPDATARTLAEGLTKVLGRPVIVENKPGASGNIAAGMVAKASDDHTFGIVINGNLTSAKLLNPNLPFDPATDFQLISLVATAPLLLVAQAQLPSGSGFFMAAKTGANHWNYGSPGNGTVAHLGMELLKSMVPGMNAVHIPFAGNPQVVTGMIGGQIQMALIPPGVAMPQVRAGKLKVIGVTGGRSTVAPEVPSLAEAGIQGFNLEVWNALIGPANLSQSVVNKLSEAVVKVLRDPETRQRLLNQGWQAVGTAPEGLALRVTREAAELGTIIKNQGIKTD